MPPMYFPHFDSRFRNCLSYSVPGFPRWMELQALAEGQYKNTERQIFLSVSHYLQGIERQNFYTANGVDYLTTYSPVYLDLTGTQVERANAYIADRQPSVERLTAFPNQIIFIRSELLPEILQGPRFYINWNQQNNQTFATEESWRSLQDDAQRLPNITEPLRRRMDMVTTNFWMLSWVSKLNSFGKRRIAMDALSGQLFRPTTRPTGILIGLAPSPNNWKVGESRGYVIIHDIINQAIICRKYHARGLIGPLDEALNRRRLQSIETFYDGPVADVLARVIGANGNGFVSANNVELAENLAISFLIARYFIGSLAAPNFQNPFDGLVSPEQDLLAQRLNMIPEMAGNRPLPASLNTLPPVPAATAAKRYAAFTWLANLDRYGPGYEQNIPRGIANPPGATYEEVCRRCVEILTPEDIHDQDL